MNFVLDTNAISETEKPRPNPGLIIWHDAQDPAHLFITTVTLAEVWHGFHCLEPNHRDYDRIKVFASELPRKFRVLNFDSRAAAIWGEMAAQASGLCPSAIHLLQPSYDRAAIELSRATLRHSSAWAAKLLIPGHDLRSLIEAQ